MAFTVTEASWTSSPPLQPGLAFADGSASRQAIQYFEAYLALVPDDMDVRWQLNLAYMTLGGYPAEVPARYLMPPAAFASRQNIGRFQDVALPSGLTSFSQAGGIVIDDFEGKGQLDIVASSWDMCEPLHFFHNNGDGTFTDRASAAGLGDQLGGLNLVQADYNNDGCMDLLALRSGWQLPMRRSLLRHNCHGTFTDVTQPSGLVAVVTSTQTAAWADIDNDGLLDLFIANENSPSQLFRNKGDGTFEDISHAPASTRSPSARESPRSTTIRTASQTSTSRTPPAPTSSITTTTTAPSLRSPGRQGCKLRTSALPPGSSTTTTMAGQTSLLAATSTQCSRWFAAVSACPTPLKR